MKVLLIVNPSASSVTPRTRVTIGRALRLRHELSVAETRRRGHATELARQGAARGVDVVAVLGGDGTLNEAANGLVGSRTALAALPGGSTNVFARIIGVPDDPLAATEQLLDILDAVSPTAEPTDIRPVGLGSVNGRYFLFHVGIGFDAAVVAEVERNGSLKRWANHLYFAWAAFDTWLRRYDRSRPRFRIRLTDPGRTREGQFAICLNTDPYTFLATRPFRVAPDATLDRALSVVTFGRLDTVPLLRIIFSALGSGRHLRTSPNVATDDDLDRVSVEGFGPVPYQVDGDFLGEIERLEFRHHPDALRLVLPRG